MLALLQVQGNPSNAASGGSARKSPSHKTKFQSASQAAGSKTDPSKAILFNHALVLPPVGSSSRKPVHSDAVEAQIVSGRWAAPKSGDMVRLPDGKQQTWNDAKADKEGWITDDALGGGYAYMAVESVEARIGILEASGHSMVYVNGEPRTGDPYGNGYTRLPVLLRAGRSDLLFACGRGRVRAKLVVPRAEVEIDPGDSTLPDLIRGERARTQGALIAINATATLQPTLMLSASLAGARPVLTPLPILQPLSVRKVAFQVQGMPPATGDNVAVHLRLMRREHGGLREIDHVDLTLRVRNPGQTYKHTFVSGIDGSVQYYAVNPASIRTKSDAPPALVLTLHGAGVEAIGQADAYETKPWATFVAPTNRRPYGFDWEDWGRLDAIEALELAQRDLHIDPTRVYLAGHSMGGHGTWQIGAHFPGRFAAIGPSAGWISFTSYVGVKLSDVSDPVEAMLNRAALPSDTLALGHNYAQEGIYILHGSADDNVPVTEARAMSHYLGDFHRDFVFWEQPGAGHWWDVSPEPGADCVDWAPMYDFFARHTLPPIESVRQVDFTTADPGVSDRDRWLSIDQQVHPLQISSARILCDPGLRRYSGSTVNVAHMQFDLCSLQPGGPLELDVDNQKLSNISWPTGGRLDLARVGQTWELSSPLAPSQKRPERTGPFKAAFRNRMIFVYGTRGEPEENAWSFAKARYDAETFWYRGNGSIDVVADTAFNPSREPDRNVILYGNADTNGAWQALLGDSPVQMRHGLIQVGARRLNGDDLACLFLRPRPGSDHALVGVVSGSGLKGMRLTDRLPYFVSGVSYPDVVVMVAGADYPDLTVIGMKEPGKDVEEVLGAGFFGSDWGIDSGEFAWKK